MLASIRHAVRRDSWSWAAAVLTALGVVALVAVATLAAPQLACRTLRPAPGGFAPAICIWDRTARAQGALRLDYADQVDDVFRICSVMAVLALVALLTLGPAAWRRGVAVMVGVVMVGLAGRLWMLGILPGLAMSAGALAAGAAAVRALLRPPASALCGADGQGAPRSGEPRAER